MTNRFLYCYPLFPELYYYLRRSPNVSFARHHTLDTKMNLLGLLGSILRYYSSYCISQQQQLLLSQNAFNLASSSFCQCLNPPLSKEEERQHQSCFLWCYANFNCNLSHDLSLTRLHNSQGCKILWNGMTSRGESMDKRSSNKRQEKVQGFSPFFRLKTWLWKLSLR